MNDPIKILTLDIFLTILGLFLKDVRFPWDPLLGGASERH